MAKQGEDLRSQASCSSKTNPSSHFSSKKKLRWEVTYSRFFPVIDGGPAPAPLTRSNRLKDAWLSCRSTASLSLFLLRKTDKKTFCVTVSLGDDLIEEHLMHDLIFSWPQVSCVPQCPIRGSRVVFLSYKDQSNQIQKFAVRFSESSVAEEFLNSVKECSKEMNAKEKDPSPESEPSVISVSSMVPYKHHYKRKRKRTSSVTSSEQRPIAMCKVEGVPVELDYTNYNNNSNFFEANNNDNSNINYNNNELEGNNNILIEPLMACEDLDSLLGLPPSFTDLLNNCTSSVDPGQIVQAGGAYNSYQNAVPIPAPESKIDQDADLMAQIMKYVNDDSFQATVCKIEKLVGEMGGGWIF